MSNNISNEILSMSDAMSKRIPMVVMHLNEKQEVTEVEEYNLDQVHIDDYALESLARCLLPDIIAFYEDPKNEAEFQEWVATQPSKSKSKPQSSKKRRRKTTQYM